MGFVTEYTDDNAREFLKRYELPCVPKWTFDREREIYLTFVKSTIQDEIWLDYCLIYKSEKVEIDVQENVYREEIHTLKMFINSIVAPKHLKPDCDDIVAVIREAFTQLHSVELIQGNPPVKSNYNFVIEKIAEPQFGFRELHHGKIMLLEIISSEGSVMLFSMSKYGISPLDLSSLLAEAERQCRDNHTEFMDFFTKDKNREWGILTQDIIKYGEENPDWCWNRETQTLYRPGEQ